MKFFRRALAFAFAHQAAMFIVLLATTTILLLGACGIHLKEDIIEMLPPSDPYVRAYSLMLAHFQQSDTVLIDISSDSPDNAAMEKVARSLASDLKKSALFRDVISRTDPEEIQLFLAFMFRHQPQLFGKKEAAEFLNRTSLESIRSILGERRKILLETPAPTALQQFTEDPLFFNEIYLKKLSDYRRLSGNITLHHGFMYSHDRKHLLLIAQPSLRHIGDEEAELFVNKVESILQKQHMDTTSGIRIGYLAAQRFQHDNARMIKADIQKTLTLSLAAIALIVGATFRRPLSSAALSLLPAFFGGLLATAALSWFYPAVSAISIGCGAMLAGIVVDFGIHFLYLVDSAEGSSAARPAVLEIAAKLFRPMLVAAGNTVIAFLLLMFSILPGYHQLGLFSALSVAGAFLFSMLFLPLLSSKRKPPKRSAWLHVNRAYPPLFRWIREHERAVRIAGFVWLLFCMIGIPRVRLEGDVQKLNGIAEQTRRDWQSIVHSFGDINDVSRTIIEGTSLQSALEQNEKLMPVLEGLKARQVIGAYGSVSVFFPSLRTQKENAKRWQTFWSRQRIGALQKNLQIVCDELGMNCGAFNPFLTSLTASGQWITQDDFDQPLLRELILSHIAPGKDRTYILIDFQAAGDSKYAAAASAIKTGLPEALLFDGDAFVRHVQDLTLSELIRLGTLTIAVVVIIFWLYARNFREVLQLLWPLLVTLICTFGIMGWLNLPFYVLSCIILIFVFGLVDDYCVFLHSAFRESTDMNDEHLISTSGAVTLSALTTLVGIGCLALGRHPTLHIIGITSLLAIGTGLLAVLFSLPWLGLKKHEGTTAPRLHEE